MISKRKYYWQARRRGLPRRNASLAAGLFRRLRRRSSPIRSPHSLTGTSAQPRHRRRPAPAPATTLRQPRRHRPLQPAGHCRPAAQATGAIRSIAVRGNQRLEPETIRAYANLAPGQSYTAETLDTALKELYATELFSDVVITGAETGNIVITVQENPVINRIILEGNKRIKDDKILPEIKLKPREIFTRSKVRADVERIIELYKRQGRFAARVEPKVVNLEQNRVDLVFEVYEGDKSKVRSINIIGNEAFGDERLRKEMFTRQAGGVLGFLKSNDSYDPDRLAADQQKLRAFYLTQGYADFRVVSALAELTPDRRDFVITYVVEEGPRYKFGTIEAESALRDLPPEKIKRTVNLQPGEWFNAKAVEDAVTRLNEEAGNPRLRVRRHQSRLQSQRREAGDGRQLPRRRDAAQLCRAHRHPGQHLDARQGHPPRIPHQRGRCLQLAEGEAFAGSPAVARLLPGESGDQADRRLDARPGGPGRQRRREVDRRAPAVGRLFEPREVHPRFLDRPAELHGQGPGAQCGRELVALFEGRSSSALSSLICSTSRSCSAAISSAAITTASITSEATATRPIRRPARARRSASASRSRNISRSARATR